MKRVIIVHRWDGKPDSDWYPWLKKELEKRGFEVVIPEMPNTAEPKINEWIEHLRKIVKIIDQNTYFIGHSIGCQTIMRFLEKTEKKIGGAIFVAGWFKLDNLEGEEVKNIARPWLENKINTVKVKDKINKLIVILSDNEPYGHVSDNTLKFKSELGAKVIIEKEKGHFTEDDGIRELPSALNALLEIAK